MPGFLSLAVFGLALSLPLVVLVLVPATRPVLDRIAGLARRVPVLAGLVLVLLGLWSIGFGLRADLPRPGDREPVRGAGQESRLTP